MGIAVVASSQQGLQHALDRFSAACDQSGMKISTAKTEILCLQELKAVWPAYT